MLLEMYGCSDLCSGALELSRLLSQARFSHETKCVDVVRWCNSDCVHMGCNNPTIDLILNKTVSQLRCLRKLLIQYSIHIPVYMLQSIV